LPCLGVIDSQSWQILRLAKIELYLARHSA